MTNKPMLSVECLLMDIRQSCELSKARDAQIDAALVELRAILDKPAEPSKFVGAAQYWSENEQALRDVFRFEGLKGLVYQVVRDRERTDAQHQGETVELQHMAVSENTNL